MTCPRDGVGGWGDGKQPSALAGLIWRGSVTMPGHGLKEIIKSITAEKD